MSFISLPHDFDPETGACRSYQIVKQDAGASIPVGFLRGDRGLPVDFRRLAENFAAMLNGNNPIYRLGAMHRMYYEKHSGGLTFRFRPGTGAGVSEVGALFTLMPGIDMDFDDAADS